jgi:hypothetical protein
MTITASVFIWTLNAALKRRSTRLHWDQTDWAIAFDPMAVVTAV